MKNAHDLQAFFAADIFVKHKEKTAQNVYDLLAGCPGHRLPYDSETCRRVTTRFEIAREEDGRYKIFLERKSLDGKWFAEQGVYTETIREDWLDQGWEHFMWRFRRSYPPARFHYDADELKARDDLRAFLGIRPPDGFHVMEFFSQEWQDERFICRFERTEPGLPSLFWRYEGRYGSLPETGGQGRLDFPADVLASWQQAAHFVVEQLLPQVCGKENPADRFWAHTESALIQTLCHVDSGEACDVLGIPARDTAARDDRMPTVRELDLMKGREEIELPEHTGYALRSYCYLEMADGSLWFSCLIVDYLGSRTMPHGERHLIPRTWLAGGWEVFLNWFSECFDPSRYVFTRDMLVECGELKAFLGF